MSRSQIAIAEYLKEIPHDEELSTAFEENISSIERRKIKINDMKDELSKIDPNSEHMAIPSSSSFNESSMSFQCPYGTCPAFGQEEEFESEDLDEKVEVLKISESHDDQSNHADGVFL